MKKKTTIGFIIALVLLLLIVFFVSDWNTPYKKQSRGLQEILATGIEEPQTGADLFPFEYDRVHVAGEYQSLDNLSDESGISMEILEQFQGKDTYEVLRGPLTRILFVKDQEAVVYLFGEPYKMGFLLDLEPGIYPKEEIDSRLYDIKEKREFDSDGNQKEYLLYRRVDKSFP